MPDSQIGPNIDAIIIQSQRITPDNTEEVRQIQLQIDDPSFRYMQGQSIGVAIPGPHPFGNRPHQRRYTIAEDRGLNAQGKAEFSILVRRCFYIDDINGERYPGIASNFLCDAKPGDKVNLTGPYKSPFHMPPSTNNNVLMIGTGTGIAPFRAFIQMLYQHKRGWQGKVRLFYGAKSGMDLLYMNDENNDLANYYDEATFESYLGLAGRPLESEKDGLERTLEQNAQEIWDLIQDNNTHLYLAGLKDISDAFDKKMSAVAGSEKDWSEMKQRLLNEKRMSELLYN